MSGRVSFTFEGRPISAAVGQSIASALLAAGIRQLSWSARYRRPRGLRCGVGACPTCALRVDGMQAVTSCITPVRGGERVEREPAHTSGAFALPTGDMPIGDYDERDVDTLVIGAGRTGLTAAIDAAAQGVSVLVVDRDWEAGGRLLSSPGGRTAAGHLARRAAAGGAELALGTTAIGEFAEGIWGLVRRSGLVAVRARLVVRATGGYDREYAFDDGDLPGVMLVGAVQRLLVRDGVLPGSAAVVAGIHEDADDVAAMLRHHGVTVTRCAPTDLLAAHGRCAVEAVTVRTRDGSRRVQCDTVVLALGKDHADEIERLAGSDGR